MKIDSMFKSNFNQKDTNVMDSFTKKLSTICAL